MNRQSKILYKSALIRVPIQLGCGWRPRYGEQL